MLFKDKLVILRKSKGLTQDEFASAVGVSRQAVYKWECGQSYPEVPKLLEMKLLLSISIDELLDDNFDIPLPEKKKRRKRKPKEVTETVAAEEQSAPAQKAEPAVVKEEPVVAAEVAAVKEEPVAAVAEPAAVKEEPVAVKVEAAAPKAEPAAPKAEPAPAQKDEKKSNSFFSKLFGKKYD